VTAPTDIHDRTRAWVDAGIIDAAQAEQIVAYERAVAPATPVGATPATAEHPRDRVAALFGVFGGLLVGLGVLLSVAANWDSIGDSTRVAVLVVSMLVAYGGALLADARSAPRWAGTTGWLVGILIFAAGVFLIGQIYNVRAHDPLGFLVVAIAAGALTLLVDRMATGWVAAIASIAWVVHELVDSLNQADDDQTAIQLVGATTLLGIGAFAGSWLLERAARNLALPMRSVALAGLAAVLVPVSFAWHDDGNLADASRASAQLLVMGVLALAATATILRAPALAHRRSMLAALLAAIALVVIASLVQVAYFAGIAANVLLALGGVGLALLGLVESRRDMFAWGIAWIVLLVAARYLDFLFSFDLGGIGFIGAGLLLIGIAWAIHRSRRLWRERDEVLG
jgi:uncharacterized membrane protein